MQHIGGSARSWGSLSSDFEALVELVVCAQTTPQRITPLNKIKGPDNPTCVFFRKSVAVDEIGSLSKGTSECASVSQ